MVHESQQTPSPAACFILLLYSHPTDCTFQFSQRSCCAFKFSKKVIVKKLNTKCLFPQQFEGLTDNSIFHVNNQYIIKIDKEQRNVSLYSLNASEKRNVKIMVRGTTKMEIVWQFVGEKRESVWKKRSKCSVPARNFCLRAKVAPTTHFLGPDITRKGQCNSIFLICKREETVGKLRKWKWQFIWSWHGASLFIHNRGNLR